MISKDEILEIVEVLDEYYVRISKCNEIQSGNNERFANDDTRIKLFDQKMSQWEWIFKLIATGTIGTLVTSLISLVIK